MALKEKLAEIKELHKELKKRELIGKRARRAAKAWREEIPDLTDKRDAKLAREKSARRLLEELRREEAYRRKKA